MRRFRRMIFRKENEIMKSKMCVFAFAAMALAMSIGTTSVFARVNSKYFTDVNENSYGWSADAVDYLLEKDVASGVGNGKFAPGSEIKRCDFVVLLDRAFKLTPFSDFVANFNDINSEDYYYAAVVNAKGAGIIKNDYAFYPQVPITRGDAMQMLYAALDKAGYIKDASTDLSMYSDADDVRDVNSQLALGTLTKMGIISGSEGKIMFASTMSRAEMAMVFYKALNYMDENEPVSVAKPTFSTKTETENKNTDTDTETDTEETKTNNVFKGKDSKTTIYVDGEEVTGVSDSNIRISESSATAVDIAKDVNASIEDSLVQVSGANAVGISLDRGASAEIDSTQISAGANNAYGVNGSDSTKVVISEGKIIVDGNKASGVYTSGTAEINDAEISVNRGSAVTAVTGGRITVEGAKITADNVQNGVFYAVTPRGENKGSTRITVKDCDITGDRRTTLFYANNNDLKATLENCNIEKVGKLVDSGATSEAKGSGSSSIEIDLINQKLEADVTCEDISRVVINLKSGSHLIAAVNSQDIADYIEINVEEGSTLELVENSYINYLEYDSIYDIHDKGRVIYYDGDDSRNRPLQEGDFPLPDGGYMTPMEK